ncbi:hypothetical protein ABT095_17800 [Kitasatospora sp. NPDC002227]|uniref:hypothetical protein n=1 Tax=Kitasatospora sp. NPDC002227 TaxID=3154773 RepID=UPI00331CF30D
MPKLYRAGAGEFWRFWWRYLAGPGMWILLTLCVMQLGPTWSAHQNHGRTGTWTVTRIACSKGHCGDIGRFVSADGSDVRTELPISGGSSLGVGGSVAAVDTGGDTVYPPGGGTAWLTVTVVTTVLAVLCALWVWTFPVALIRRRRAARRDGRPVTGR